MGKILKFPRGLIYTIRLCLFVAIIIILDIIHILGGGRIVLDDEVIIGPYCCIVAGNHTMVNDSYRFGKYQYGQIEIGRGTWLGAHVTITANVKIGKGCVIAANAVVTKDVPDFTMVGGVPAKFIKNTK